MLHLQKKSLKIAIKTNLITLILCLGIAARETAQALKTLAQAARGVAASTTDPKAAAAMLDSARDVMEGSALLIHEAKQALISPGDAESQQRLAQVMFFNASDDCWCCRRSDCSAGAVKADTIKSRSRILQVVNTQICPHLVRI